MKRILTILCLLATLTAQAQNADERIGTLISGSRWFDLERELKVTPADSVNPMLYKMATALTHHYFNRPDSACIVLEDLLNNYPEALGDNTLSMAMLMGVNLARTDRYAEAAGLIQDICSQLAAQGVDSTQTGNAEADSIVTALPPVIGMPVMLRMQEVQLDFEHRQFIIPTTPSPNPLSESNLLRTDGDNLRIATTDEDGQPLLLHFDTGGYSTTLLPYWYERNQAGVQADGTPDSLRVAGVGGVSITRSYRLPYKEFRLGNGTTVLDSVMVDTGIDLHTGVTQTVQYLNGAEDGTIGLDILENFKMVILNLEEMYIEAIPY